jgi:hypothetical protein
MQKQIAEMNAKSGGVRRNTVLASAMETCDLHFYKYQQFQGVKPGMLKFLNVKKCVNTIVIIGVYTENLKY